MRLVRAYTWLILGIISASFLHSVALGQGSGYWHTSGSRILDANGKEVRIAGLNWYGFETSTGVVHGLTSEDYVVLLKNMKAQGFNTIRLPFSSQMIETPATGLNISYANASGPINSDLNGLNALQVMDKIVEAAGTIGLKVILDNHRSEAGNSAEASGLWYTSAYPESAWISDWQMLANRYLGNATVIGFDLRNEPHNAASGGSCWDCGGALDWHLAAERAGNAVLSVNPQLLIFVEGTDAYNNDYYWWGGNLEGVAYSPVVLSVPNQLVYEAHDYGPTEYAQTWFSGATYASLSTVWSKHWAYISQNGMAPVWLGEFGTTNDDASINSNVSGSEGQWFSSLVVFLNSNTSINWTYWAMNGEDLYAYLTPGYDAPASASKEAALQTIQFPLPDLPAAAAPAAPSNLTATATSASQVSLSWTASPTSSISYSLYMGTSASSISTLVGSGITATSYQATGLNASTQYYFDVVAVNTAATSAASNLASATTQSLPSNTQATVALSNLNVVYDGTPHTVGFTTNPVGLAVTVLYNGSVLPPTAAGNYVVTATISDPRYSGASTATLVVSKAPVAVSLGNLQFTYDGQTHAAIATTVPAGISMSITYNGVNTAPTAAGSYAAIATVTDPNYIGSVSGTLTIAKATAVVTMSDLSVRYDGNPHAVVATTTPANLMVEVTYAGSNTVPVLAGTYPVAAVIMDPNYDGAGAATLTILRGIATISITTPTATYDGSAHGVVVTTNPVGLTTSVTYNGLADVPVNAGSYTVTAVVNDPNYKLSTTTGSFNIARAAVSIGLGSLNVIYSGTSQTVIATTIPAGLPVTTTYAGSSTAPVFPGSYAVVATVSDANYKGTSTGTFIVAPVKAAVSLQGMMAFYDGQPQTPRVLTSPGGIAVAVTFNGDSMLPSAVGTYVVTATITDRRYTGITTGTFTIMAAHERSLPPSRGTGSDVVGLAMEHAPTQLGLVCASAFTGSEILPSSASTAAALANSEPEGFASNMPTQAVSDTHGLHP